MELTNLKRIKNENLKSADLPKYWNGTPGGTPFETNMVMFGQPANTLAHATGTNPNGADAAKGAGPWFALGAWAGGGIMLGLKAVRNQDELLNDAGTSMGNAGGIGYSRQNTIDLSQYMKEYDKGTAMSFLTNPFEGIARIFGRSDQKELIRKANQIAMNHNNFGESGAMTLKLLLEGAKNNLDSQSQLRGYQDGRGTENSGGWARVSNGETIVRGNLVIGVIPGLPNFKDGVVAHIGNDGVISNHETIPGLRNSTYAAITNDVQGALALDKMWRKEHGKGYKNGKLPCFKEGYLGNLIPSGIGMLASIGQYVDAASLDIHRPNVKASNIYGQSALNDLAGLSINQYPIMNKLYGAQATANNAIDLTGGLSGYQRSKLYSVNLRNTQKNISDTLANALAQNNQYRAALASAKMQLGEHEAQRALLANIYSDEAFAKAHGAKQQGKQMGIYNFLNQLLSYYANEFKRRLFNDTMGLYRLQQDLDKARFDSELARYNDSKKQGVYLTPNLVLPMMNMLLKYYGVD